MNEIVIFMLGVVIGIAIGLIIDYIHKPKAVGVISLLKITDKETETPKVITGVNLYYGVDYIEHEKTVTMDVVSRL